MPQNDMQSDFENAASASAADQYKQRAAEIKARRAAEEQAAAPVEQSSSEGEEMPFERGSLPDGQTVYAAGLEKLGMEPNFDVESIPFGPRKARMRGEIMRAGSQALGVSASDRFWNILGQTGQGVATETNRAASIAARDGGAVGRDVSRAVANPGDTLKQIPGGIIDARNELGQFGLLLETEIAKMVD